MVSYSVVIEETAAQELRHTPSPFRRQINQRIIKLKAEPRPEGAELVTEPERYRLLVVGWWLLYEVDDVGATVTIVAIRAARP